MKKLLFLFLLFPYLAFANPSNTVSTPNSFSPNTVISSSQVNSNFNEIQSKFNAHTHTDITNLGTVIVGTWDGSVIQPSYGGTGTSAPVNTASGAVVMTAAGQYPNLDTTALNINGSSITSGTVAAARLGSGSANTATFLRGDNTWTPPSSAITFNASGNFTVPSGITVAWVTAVGGGGGGAGGDSTEKGGGGGGGGVVLNYPISVTPGNTYNVVVGINGTAGANVAPGGVGGDSYVTGDIGITVTGGGGGGGQPGYPGDGGGGGSCNTNGCYNGIVGNNGTLSYGADSGGHIFGVGATGTGSENPAPSATVGYGGGGMGHRSGGGGVGGSGKSGLVIIRY